MDKKPASQQRKTPKKISKTYLENAALYYLQRYATSTRNLKRVLMRKVQRSCAFHQVPVEDFVPLVEELVERYSKVGLVDDKSFAQARVISLRRQGHSKQMIMAKLQAKGLSAEQAEAALRHVDGEAEDPEMAAALAYARRKKLGPWRKKPLLDQKDKQKELASLGRAGFSFEVARKALT
jgi:regulatory protein